MNNEYCCNAPMDTDIHIDDIVSQYYGRGESDGDQGRKIPENSFMVPSAYAEHTVLYSAVLHHAYNNPISTNKNYKSFR
jgi:hypothetical protein